MYDESVMKQKYRYSECKELTWHFGVEEKYVVVSEDNVR